jgi:hypothetical protein
VVDFAQFISDANNSRGTQSKASKTITKPKVIIKPIKSAAAQDEGC